MIHFIKTKNVHIFERIPSLSNYTIKHAVLAGKARQLMT